MSDSTVCAEGSRRRMEDEVPRGGPMEQVSTPCEHCGHPACYPGRPCQLCELWVAVHWLQRGYLGPPTAGVDTTRVTR